MTQLGTIVISDIIYCIEHEPYYDSRKFRISIEVSTMLIYYHQFIYNILASEFMKMNNKIPWGLAIGTLGITIVGAFNGTALLGLASTTGGALALVTALLAKQQIEKKKLKPELVLELA